jgi:protein-disulfide isomerase
MKMWVRFVAVPLSLGAILAGQALAATRDWTRTVMQTPAGAYIMGNPRAKVRLVEYLSLTCPHCAHFTDLAAGPLKANYIGPGLVSLEVRHAVRDPFDLAATLLARCAGAASFFPAMEVVLARQPVWMESAAAFQQQAGDLDGKSPAQRLTALADGAGLTGLFVSRGVPPARIAACLSNAAEQKRLAAKTDEASTKRKIGGTPAFMINVTLQSGVSDWPTLEPKLKAALK